MSEEPAGASAPVSLYVYYRVRPEAANDTSIRAARATLERLIAPHCARFQLLRRSEDASTWMEVLDEVADPAAALAALDAAWRTPTFAAFIDPQAPRHIERFVR
ncbi:DUF4936 family protein [Niveibacterium sp. SC-1]|uniref:DUF4936 family protein n=1 Tax=Niveibacterium sp. SC-1 TaxID=3135646 RepID=UPI00311E9329